MSDENPAQSENLKKKECDLVMKGGLTSGIVYPPLVIKLHEDGYSFRSVGGTSAGAIAAAVTAAAEHGKATGGFKKLNVIREWLGDDRNLLNLFQPSRSTAPLLRTFLIYPKLNWLRLLFLKLPIALLLGNPLFFIVGAGLGAGVAFLFAWLVGGSLQRWGFVLLALFCLIGAVLTVLVHFYLILTKTLPKNFFGICTGRGRNLARISETALTDWLTTHLNDIAGMDSGENSRPLTFGDLWAQTNPSDKKRIDLRMMTSNLSQNRPYILPFDDVYLFKKDEFEKLFPRNVVAHMEKHQRVINNFEPPAGYLLFPEAKDLPVVVATRMSLSFPVLISMVPLYTIGHDAFGEKMRFEFEPDTQRQGSARIVLKTLSSDNRWTETQQLMRIADPSKGLQLNWFSDGGICSNFPIQFFDSWLPTRPTFGVILTSQLGEQEEGDIEAATQTADPGRFSYMVQQPIPSEPEYSAATEYSAALSTVSYNTDVYLPQPGSEAAPAWTPLPDLPKFLGSVFTTAQNYRDNMQAVLPSYYERIVQIRLSDNEGGLNLEMPPEVIEQIVKKGVAAGETLATDFSMAKHQWVRFRVLMGQIEKALKRMDDVMKPDAAGVRPFDYLLLMKDQLDQAQGFPYRRDQHWCDNADTRLSAMGQTIGAWIPPDMSKEPPLPEPVLRVAPEI